MNLIAGLDRYTSGDIIVSDRSTKDYRAEDWDSYRSRYIGYVHQSYNLIGHISIQKNIEMALIFAGFKSKDREKRAKELLDRVGLLKHRNKKPNQMSGGQKQRVAIARAIACDPQIILADEPTGALDSKSSVIIAELLKELSKDKLVVMVTHNDSIAQEYSDQIIEMFDGKIENCEEVEDKITKRLDTEKSKMSLLSAFRLSMSNLRTKKARTIIMTIASSLGIIGLTLGVFLYSGYSGFLYGIEKDMMAENDIVILANQYIRTADVQYQEAVDTVQRSIDNKEAILLGSEISNVGVRVNNANLSLDYLEHIDKLDHSNFAWFDYAINQTYKFFTANATSTSDTCGFEFVNININTDTDNFKKFNFLAGRAPVSDNEILIAVDKITDLYPHNYQSLFDADVDDEYEDYLGKEIALIDNDTFYAQRTDRIWGRNIEDFDQQWANSTKLKVCGVVSREVGARELRKGLVVSNKITTDLFVKNYNCNLVKAQRDADYNLLYDRGFATELEKNSFMREIGAIENFAFITIVPKDMDAKKIIETHLSQYNIGLEDSQKIFFKDGGADVIGTTAMIMDSVGIVLIVFSILALFVSSVMIGIIMFVSVAERTNEIGILKSLGARNLDIRRIFTTESTLIGLFAGVFGTIIASVLSLPINILIKDFLSIQSDLIKPNILIALLMVVVSFAITFVSAYVPAHRASKKDIVKALRSE